jgi:hypothetical protein
VNPLGDDIDTMKKKTETLANASREVGPKKHIVGAEEDIWTEEG